MTCPHCGHTRHYAGGGLLSCAKCGRWLEADAEPVLQPELQVAIEQLQSDAPPVAQTERTVTIAGTGRGKKRGKR